MFFPIGLKTKIIRLTIKLIFYKGMHYQHDNEESFENLDEYLKYKRRVDLDKVEAFVRQQEEQQQLLDIACPPSAQSSKRTNFDLDDDDDDDEEKDENMAEINLLEQSRLERAKYLIANRELFENDLNLDLDIDPDISCPVLTNEERIEKLSSLVADTRVQDEIRAAAVASAAGMGTPTPPRLDLFDTTECIEVNEILKSREVWFYLFFDIPFLFFFSVSINVCPLKDLRL